jgi:hypothetical protein
MRYPDYSVTPKPDGSFNVVSKRPAIGLFRAVCLGLFIAECSWAPSRPTSRPRLGSW